MYKFTLKHRDDAGLNLIDPFKIRQGDPPNVDAVLIDKDHVSKLEVTPGTYTYSEKDVAVVGGRYLVLYDFRGQIMDDGFFVSGGEVIIPTNVAFIDLPVASNESGTPVENICFARGSAIPYEPYYTSREVKAIYKSLKLEYDKSGTGEYYRRKLKGTLTLQNKDYLYIDALDFETQMFLKVEDSQNIIEEYVGYFFKTDCKFNADNLTIQIKTEVLDDYEKVIAGMQRNYNILELNPELETVELNRRPIIQVYIPGDNVITNILGGTYWEQELQVDPVFDLGELINTYKFFNTQDILTIPVSAAPGLSTDVTGTYGDDRINENGLYKLIELQSGTWWYGKKYRIQRISDSAILYETEQTDWMNTSVNSLLFSGVNGETGSFYFAEYRIFVRYYLDLLETFSGETTYAIPSTDIVANNSNYKRIVGYNLGIERFKIYDEFLTVPTVYGRVPDDAPDGGKYYKGLQLPGSTGVDREPIPISSSNWRSVSLWFLTDDAVQFTEFKDGSPFSLRDAFPLDSVIQTLLTEMGANVSFLKDVEHSEFFYASTNPLGGFSYTGDYSPSGNPDFIGNLDYFITPKSNLVNANYDQPAKKAELSLQQIFKMLSDVFKVHWYIDNGRLRLEHVSWYQKGGTYSASPVIGSDLTVLQNVKANKSWDYLQNNFEYDKEAMAERYEYGWMDDTSPIFEGSPINILSNYTQEGKIEDASNGRFTTDVDFVQANPQEISKDGFVLLSAVNDTGKYKVPYMRWYNPDAKQYMMQNGFLSWSYIHPKYHISDLPSDKVNINGQDTVLVENITKQKKQKVKFPLVDTFNPYQLITTGIGNGKIEKISVDLESNMVEGELKHDTNGNT